MADKIKSGDLLRALKADMKEAERLQQEWFIKRKEWLAETYGQPYGNEEKGKSAIVSKDIKKQLEWMLPTITDPFISSANVIKCSPITAEDEVAARQNELLLNTQFCRKFPRYNFIMKAARVLASEGTVVVQTGWDYEEKTEQVEMDVVVMGKDGVEQISKTMTEHTTVVRNQPTAVVCRNEDIFIDPTCQDDMEKCQFVIHRYESNLSTLRADGRYKNLDKVEERHASLYDDPQYYRQDLTYFEFKDTPRKKFVVHEYWGNYDVNGDGIAEPIVCAWVGNVIIRLQSNPYPDGKPPFVVVPFNPIPFQMYGEALAENIGDNQKVKTAITRGIIDNMAQSNNGQIGMKKGALDVTNRKKFLQGKNFEYNGTPSDFWQGTYNQIPNGAFNFFNLMTNEIESQTGVKSFSGGINAGALGGTATGARGALDATATRRLNIVRNISENLIKPLMRKWMAYNAEFLDEEEVVRVTNEQYVPVRRDDLEGQIDIDLTISTAEDNAAKSQELSFLLQTLGPNEDPMIRRHIMSDIYELMRMPEEAKRLREYQPQPDPIQEQMKQLELAKLQMEIKKMEADIADKYARAGENQVDRQLKLTKAQVEAAKARKLNSDADMTDLDFLQKNDGVGSHADADKQIAELKKQIALSNMNHQQELDKQLALLNLKHEQEMQKQSVKHANQMELAKLQAASKSK